MVNGLQLLLSQGRAAVGLHAVLGQEVPQINLAQEDQDVVEGAQGNLGSGAIHTAVLVWLLGLLAYCKLLSVQSFGNVFFEMYPERSLHLL